ncbi:hypothetical protein V3C99_015673 [Haemonchus contortus]|uniref:Polyprotein n=1 Tax=Haemonchus contortus TaxID=6289 RepID=A0A7I4YVS3_HAECO|nr:unnamed protein product [Haemonchus contortus]
MPARWNAKAMEAMKEGHDTSKMHGPQRIDIMSKVSDAIADECLANDMSVIEPALALLDTRGVHALSGPTLYMEYWDSEENLDETVIERDYFEYSSEPRCNQLSSIARFKKVRNVTDILPPLGEDKEKACSEGPVPNNPAEAQGEQEQSAVEEHISGEVTRNLMRLKTMRQSF